MNLTLTLILLAASVGLTVLAGWRGGRPPDLIRGARMVPWRFVMILSAALAFLLIIHLGTLAGMPQRG